MKYLAIKTISNEKVKLSTYNLVSEEKVNQLINQYVSPDANPEFKMNWEKQMSNKGD